MGLNAQIDLSAFPPKRARKLAGRRRCRAIAVSQPRGRPQPVHDVLGMSGQSVGAGRSCVARSRVCAERLSAARPRCRPAQFRPATASVPHGLLLGVRSVPIPIGPQAARVHDGWRTRYARRQTMPGGIFLIPPLDWCPRRTTASHARRGVRGRAPLRRNLLDDELVGGAEPAGRGNDRGARAVQPRRDQPAAPELTGHGFEEGLPRASGSPGTRRSCRFSTGVEELPSSDRRGSFSDGVEQLPAAPEDTAGCPLRGGTRPKVVR
jgi:hypothetical protein